MINQELVKSLEKITDPQKLIGEIYSRFGNRAAIGTSGQLTGVVMIDMAVRAGVKNPRIFTIDTLRLFVETVDLFKKIEKRYGVKIEWVRPDVKKVEKMVRDYGEHLFFDSKSRQEYCCRVRKVEPNEKVLESLDVWLTGLRSDQSKARAETLKFKIINHPKNRRSILKVAPLVSWSELKLKKYIRDKKVPVHELLLWRKNGWYYESLGCRICTTPIGPTEPRRAGRWRWFNAVDDAKECGLHAPPHED